MSKFLRVHAVTAKGKKWDFVENSELEVLDEDPQYWIVYHRSSKQFHVHKFGSEFGEFKEIDIPHPARYLPRQGLHTTPSTDQNNDDLQAPIDELEQRVQQLEKLTMALLEGILYPMKRIPVDETAVEEKG